VKEDGLVFIEVVTSISCALIADRKKKWNEMDKKWWRDWKLHDFPLKNKNSHTHLLQTNNSVTLLLIPS
jgi:hypothetical protein